MLSMNRHGSPITGEPPLVVAHGLFGAGRNWGRVAKTLQTDREVVTVDLRNHGDSDWTETHTYADLAGDLSSVIASVADGRADLLGHSMGGKAAMLLALREPARVRRLVVIDIAPVTYGHDQMQFVEAMQALDLAGLDSRSAADAALAAGVPDPGIRSFLLSSLDVRNRRWRLNLATLGHQMAEVMGFPETGTARFDGPTLFLAGGASDYVLAEHHDAIRTRFPAARIETVAGAGHWVHAERPDAVAAAVAAFLAE